MIDKLANYDDFEENFEKPLIEVIEGEVAIILSIPHGGTLDNATIPNRVCKCKDASEHVQGGKKCPVVLLNDGFTIDLGMEIAKSIKMHLQLGPYVIINNLRRAKLDPNREIAIGAQDSAAIEAFEAYHDGIDQLKTKLKRALLIDLHGRVSNDSINQVGYCLNRSHLITNSHSSQLDPHVGSSITTLAKENPSLNLITGSLSFGAFIEQEGLKAVPAPKIPNPGPAAYMSGGYITKRHSSDGLDGIQLETPRDLRIGGGEEGRKQLGHSIGKAISEFYKCHYMLKYKNEK